MATHNVFTQWDGNMQFTSKVDDFNIKFDADESVGGKNAGPRPKKLMLSALAGCTGMDVIAILNKMKVVPDEFSVDIEGETTEEHPKQYSKVKIIYNFKGKNLDRNKIEKAINMSIDKYCGVYAVYRKAMDMEHEIRINES